VYLVTPAHFRSRDKMAVTPFDPPYSGKQYATRKLRGCMF